MKKILSLFIFISLIYSTFSIAQTYNYGSVALGGGGFVSAIITCSTEKNLIYARTDVGGAYRWNNADNSWIPLTDWAADNETGYLGVEALAVDPTTPSKVYMLVGIDYFNGGKTAILRSSDYGATFAKTDVSSQFKAHGNGMGRQNGERLAVDPNKGSIIFCGSRRNGLFKSADAGVSWTNVSSFPVSTTNNDNGINFIVFDKTSASTGNATQTIYAGVSRMGSSNIYVSKNGGTSWTAIAGQTTTYMPQRAVLASDGNLFITYGNGAGPHGHWSVPEPMDNGQIWKFNTANNTWTNISPVLSGTTAAFSGISVDAANPQRIIATTINKYMQQPWGWGDRIFLSTNGGASWTDLIGTNGITMSNNGMSWIDDHAMHWAGSIEIDPYNADRVFLTSGNGIFVCENLSATQTTWKFMTKGLEETVPLDIVSIPGGPLVSVIGDYDGCTQTDISQSVPTHSPGMGTTTGVDYAGKKSTYVVRVGGWDGMTFCPLYYSNNSGSSWTNFGTMPNNGNYYKGKVAVSADGTTVLWTPEGQNTAFKTTNNGTSWTTVNGYNIGSGRITSDKVNANKFYTYNPNTGYVFVSTNAGATFTQTVNVGSYGSNILRTVPDIEGDVWIPLYNGGLSRSTNSGASFTKVSTVSACTAVGFGKAPTGKTFPTVFIWGTVNGTTGVFRSDDAGLSWLRVNDNDHQWGGAGNGQFVIGDMNTYGRFFMSTAGRGIAYGEPNNTPPPAISISLAAGSTSLCNGESTTLTATPTLTSGTVTTVDFYEETSLLASDNTAPYTYQLTNPSIGTHTYTAIVLSSTGATATSSAITVTVNADGNAIVPYLKTDDEAWLQQNSTQLCTGGSVIVGPQPNTANGWTWTGPNNFVANTREISFIGMTTLESGVYTAIYDDGVNCPSKTDFTITVNESPQPIVVSPIHYDQNATATALEANGTNLKWYSVETGGTATTAPTPNTAIVGTTSYYVSQTVNGCESTRAQINVEVTSSMVTQSIILNSGWNLISINIHPADSSIGTLFSGFDVREIKNMDSFWLKGQSDVFNSLKTITPGNGYLVNMNIAGTLTVTGTTVETPNLGVSTITGWNLIGCPFQTPTPFTSDFNSTNCQLIKNFEGFWIPNGTTNSIENREPGEGYFLNK